MELESFEQGIFNLKKWNKELNPKTKVMVQLLDVEGNMPKIKNVELDGIHIDQCGGEKSIVIRPSSGEAIMASYLKALIKNGTITVKITPHPLYGEWGTMWELSLPPSPQQVRLHFLRDTEFLLYRTNDKNKIFLFCNKENDKVDFDDEAYYWECWDESFSERDVCEGEIVLPGFLRLKDEHYKNGLIITFPNLDCEACNGEYRLEYI